MPAQGAVRMAALASGRRLGKTGRAERVPDWGHLLAEYEHMMISIQPKYSVS